MSVKLIRRTKDGPVYQVKFKFKNQRTGRIDQFRRRFALPRKEVGDLELHLKIAAKTGKLDEVLAALDTETRSIRSDSEPENRKTPEPALTFQGFANKWFRNKRNKPSEKETKELHIRRHLIPFFGDTPLRDVTAENCEEFTAHMLRSESNRGRPFAPKTVRNVQITLRTMLRAALKWGHIDWNPMDDVELIEPDRTPEDFTNYFTKEQVAAYISAVKKHYPKWYPFVLTLATSAARFGEVAALEKLDISWNKRTITFKRSVRKGMVTTPKGNRSHTFSMSLDLVEALKEQCNRHPGAALVFPTPKSQHIDRKKLEEADRLNRKGWYVDPKTVEKPHHGARQKGGIDKWVTLHGLRHTAGTLLASLGLNEEQIRRFLSHADTRMVARYMHLGADKDRETAEAYAREIGLEFPRGHGQPSDNKESAETLEQQMSLMSGGLAFAMGLRDHARPDSKTQDAPDSDAVVIDFVAYAKKRHSGGSS